MLCATSIWYSSSMARSHSVFQTLDLSSTFTRLKRSLSSSSLSQVACIVSARSRLHRFGEAIDAAAVFHGLRHFLAQRRDPFVAAGVLLDAENALLDRLCLLEQGGRIARRCRLGKAGGFDAGDLAENAELGQ